MTYSRNARRRAIQAGTKTPRRALADGYNLFWHYTEPLRQQERTQAALLAARSHDDARRARKGLKPRDSFWQKRLGIGA